MNHLEQKLQNLRNNYCEPLYDYNQYILKRFFEYAFDDERYVRKVLDGSTGLYKTAYCPQHEKVIMTACITALHRDNEEVYMQFYNEYLTFKTIFCGWRGRGEWFDFHRTVLSHFIWTGNMKAFYWTWTRNNEYMKDFKKKYPKVSDWRRRWYIQENGKLRLYLLRVCAVAEKLDLIKDLIDHGIVKMNKEAEGVLVKFGYELCSDGQIKEAGFVDTVEWKWLHDYGNNDVGAVDINFCVEICKRTSSNKSRIIDLLILKGRDVFWDFFLCLDKDILTFITCKGLTKLLTKVDFSIECDKIKRRVILKIFELRKYITKTLVFSLNTCLSQYKLPVDDGIVVLKGIFDEEKSDDYLYLSTKCEFFIGDSTTSTENREKLSHVLTEDLYWLYTLLGKCIQTVIHDAVCKTTPDLREPCVICLCDMEKKSACVLPCGHCFHASCIKKDMAFRNTPGGCCYSCPMCRSKVHVESITTCTTI